VRMPEPQVDVAQAQPQVEVRMAQPQVEVQQPQQVAQPTVEQAQPRVQMVQPQQEAQVQITRAQPQVQFERVGEPQIIMSEAQGQPTVRIEQMDQQQAQAARQPGQQPAAAQPGQQPVAAQPGQQPAVAQQPAPAATTAAAAGRQPAATAPARTDMTQARERLGVGAAPTTMPTAGAGQVRNFVVGDIEGMRVRNYRDENLGTVDRVVIGPDQQSYMIVNHGGFLGIGQDQVALPAERFLVHGDQLLVSGVTDQDMDAIAAHSPQQVEAFLRVEPAAQISLIVQQ
jgi:hypothetical protein